MKLTTLLLIFASYALASGKITHASKSKSPERDANGRPFANFYTCEIPCSQYYFDYSESAGKEHKKNPTIEIDCTGMKRSADPLYDGCVMRCYEIRDQEALKMCKSEMAKCASCKATCECLERDSDKILASEPTQWEECFIPPREEGQGVFNFDTGKHKCQKFCDKLDLVPPPIHLNHSNCAYYPRNRRFDSDLDSIPDEYDIQPKLGAVKPCDDLDLIERETKRYQNLFNQAKDTADKIFKDYLATQKKMDEVKLAGNPQELRRLEGEKSALHTQISNQDTQLNNAEEQLKSLADKTLYLKRRCKPQPSPAENQTQFY